MHRWSAQSVQCNQAHQFIQHKMPYPYIHTFTVLWCASNAMPEVEVTVLSLEGGAKEGCGNTEG